MSSDGDKNIKKNDTDDSTDKDNMKRSIKCEALDPFQLYGWTPKATLSQDENIMEMLLLLTRNSICRQGHMACAIVKDQDISMRDNTDEEAENDHGDNGNNNKNNGQHENPVTAAITPSPMQVDDGPFRLDTIISAAVNTPIFKPLDSDNHAEINAIGSASKRGKTTNGCTAFITMPPCKNCFGALVAAGIRRIVTTRPFFEPVFSACDQHGIERVVMETRHIEERIAGYVQEDREEVIRRRQERKEEAKKRKRAKLERQAASGKTW